MKRSRWEKTWNEKTCDVSLCINFWTFKIPSWFSYCCKIESWRHLKNLHKSVLLAELYEEAAGTCDSWRKNKACNLVERSTVRNHGTETKGTSRSAEQFFSGFN